MNNKAPVKSIARTVTQDIIITPPISRSASRVSKVIIIREEEQEEEHMAEQLEEEEEQVLELSGEPEYLAFVPQAPKLDSINQLVGGF